MASAFSHAFVAVIMGQAARHKAWGWRELALGACCSVLPDLDVIGFRFGIQYGDLWGHRGVTHSLVFAALVSAALAILWDRQKSAEAKVRLGLYVFLCTASHGVLDAMTNGGLGVAFFSPFDATRYFFPVRPILVSPIGIDAFFNGYGLRVFASEIVWIWLPFCAIFLAWRAVQRCRPVTPKDSRFTQGRG